MNGSLCWARKWRSIMERESVSVDGCGLEGGDGLVDGLGADVGKLLEMCGGWIAWKWLNWVLIASSPSLKEVDDCNC